MRHARRSFGSIRLITKRGIEYLEASYPTPAYALAENPQLPKRFTKTTAKQFKPELELWLAQAHTQIKTRTWTPPTKLNNKTIDAASMTFKQLAELYMRDIRKPDGSKLEETTLSHSEGRLRNHLLPVFGNKPISAISSADIQRWYDNFDCDEKTGRNTTARAHSYSLLRAIFNFACRTMLDDNTQPIIAKNPCTLRVRKPKTLHESKVASVQELKDLYLSMPENLRIAVIIGGACGLREGEICALTLGDIDLGRMRINVDKSLKSISYYGKPRRLEVGKPKTESSIRKVPIPQWTLPYFETLMRHRAHSAPSELVIHTRNSTFIAPSKLRESFNKALLSTPELEGMHFHDLRHTALTHYGEAGASIAELMEVAGHADVTTVARYQNISREQRERTAQRLNERAQEHDDKHTKEPASGSDDQLVGVLARLATCDMVQVLRSLPEERQAQIVEQLPADRRMEVLTLLLQ